MFRVVVLALLLAGCALPFDRLREALQTLTPTGGTTIQIRCDSGEIMTIAPAHLFGPSVPVLFRSSEVDLVVRSASSNGRLSVPLAPRDPSLGDPAWVIHSPWGYDRILTPAVLSGWDEAGLAIYSLTPYFGSSGGAVLNYHGELVGMLVSSYHAPSPYAPGLIPLPHVGFALPISTIRRQLALFGPGCVSAVD